TFSKPIIKVPTRRLILTHLRSAPYAESFALLVPQTSPPDDTVQRSRNLALPLLPWKDLTDTLFHLNMTGHLKRVKLVFTGSSAIQRIDAEGINRILDRNKGLRDLRHRGIITCEAY
ncbi:hypothetical protein CVT26_012774, partial [Gymnopilus dilepis]